MSEFPKLRPEDKKRQWTVSALDYGDGLIRYFDTGPEAMAWIKKISKRYSGEIILRRNDKMLVRCKGGEIVWAIADPYSLV
jgi:hypothetical protein